MYHHLGLFRKYEDCTGDSSVTIGLSFPYHLHKPNDRSDALLMTSRNLYHPIRLMLAQFCEY